MYAETDISIHSALHLWVHTVEELSLSVDQHNEVHVWSHELIVVVLHDSEQVWLQLPVDDLHEGLQT